MWIDEGEKYALVGLEVNQEGAPAPEQVAPNLWVLTTTTFDVPEARLLRARGCGQCVALTARSAGRVPAGARQPGGEPGVMKV